MNKKKCPNCGSFLVVKNSFTKSNLQRYKCKNCSKIFMLKSTISSHKLFNSYITEKKILSILAKENNIC